MTLLLPGASVFHKHMSSYVSITCDTKNFGIYETVVFLNSGAFNLKVKVTGSICSYKGIRHVLCYALVVIHCNIIFKHKYSPQWFICISSKYSVKFDGIFKAHHIETICWLSIWGLFADISTHPIHVIVYATDSLRRYKVKRKILWYNLILYVTAFLIG